MKNASVFKYKRLSVVVLTGYLTCTLLDVNKSGDCLETNISFHWNYSMNYFLSHLTRTARAAASYSLNQGSFSSR